MSRRNQSRRRRSYGRRQHELGERRTEHEIRWLPYAWQPDQAVLMDHSDDPMGDERRPMTGA